ncbi:MAG: hypothetical protein DRN90_06825 [Thermoproteota archaeon]|nr:MAG: hypothetical protein DRN90_06825 [Candidatus Korarchaeota archaeon]RLG73240.1 MAG: hypothetical protein DRO11_00215 [Euryarchaeota archaeon]
MTKSKSKGKGRGKSTPKRRRQRSGLVQTIRARVKGALRVIKIYRRSDGSMVANVLKGRKKGGKKK